MPLPPLPLFLHLFLIQFLNLFLRKTPIILLDFLDLLPIDFFLYLLFFLFDLVPGDIMLDVFVHVGAQIRGSKLLEIYLLPGPQDLLAAIEVYVLLDHVVFAFLQHFIHHSQILITFVFQHFYLILFVLFQVGF